MNNKVIKFDLDPKTLKVKELLNKDFLELEVNAISTAYPNRNGSHFTLESLQKAIPTFYNKPLLGSFSVNQDDFRAHEGELEYDDELENVFYDYTDEVSETPLGLIRGDDRVEIYKSKKDDLYWIKFTCAIWVKYNYKQVKKLLKSKDGHKKISVEIEVVDSYIDEDGIEVINEFIYDGCTLLGDKYETGIADASMTILDMVDNAIFQKKQQALCFAYSSFDKDSKGIVEIPEQISVQDSNIKIDYSSDNEAIENEAPLEEITMESELSEEGGENKMNLTAQMKMSLLEESIKESYRANTSEDECCPWVWANDIDDNYIYFSIEDVSYRATYTIEESEEGNKAIVDLENKERVVRSWSVFAAENEDDAEDQTENLKEEESCGEKEEEACNTCSKCEKCEADSEEEPEDDSGEPEDEEDSEDDNKEEESCNTCAKCEKCSEETSDDNEEEPSENKEEESCGKCMEEDVCSDCGKNPCECESKCEDESCDTCAKCEKCEADSEEKPEEPSEKKEEESCNKSFDSDPIELNDEPKEKSEPDSMSTIVAKATESISAPAVQTEAESVGDANKQVESLMDNVESEVSDDSSNVVSEVSKGPNGEYANVVSEPKAVEETDVEQPDDSAKEDVFEAKSNTVEVDGENVDINVLFEKYSELKSKYDELNNNIKVQKAETLAKFGKDFVEADSNVDDENKQNFVEQISTKCMNYEFTTEDEVTKFAKGLLAMYYYENRVVKENNSKDFGIDIQHPVQNTTNASNKLKDAINKLNHAKK